MTGPSANQPNLTDTCVSDDFVVLAQPLQVGGAQPSNANEGGLAIHEAGYTSNVEDEQPAQGKKKKRAEGKSLAKRGPTALPKNRGTGFEEYFADPPLTPQEALEEKSEIYAEEIPFEERIQSCIQRFRGRRRLGNDKTAFFNDYLFLGGIDTNPGMFTGVDPRDLKELTPAERRDATAKDTVHSGSGAGDRFYDGNHEHWAVDFEGVAAGYFSVELVRLSEEEMQAAVGVVENFLRYVVQHDVCPEFLENINLALEVCAVARAEWYNMRDLRAIFPGNFHIAAAELFCGGERDDWDSPGFTPPERFDAKEVFFSTLALVDEPELFAQLSDGNHAPATKAYECALAAVEVIRPCDTVSKRFKSLTVDNAHTNLSPVGKVVCELSNIEDGWVYPDLPKPFADKAITLYFEDAILAQLKPGVKMRVTICELVAGIRFITGISHLVPSYYTFLPQELMRHYKPPRDNERSAPSIRDPGAEEHQYANEEGDD